MRSRLVASVLTAIGLLTFLAPNAAGRRPIRNAFFTVYSSASGTRLDDLPSNASHCGVCHYDFDGGGPRNAYGLAVEIARNSGMYADDEAAILSLDGNDSDGDGFSNHVEITDVLFLNTPTFPGLTVPDTSLVSNVDIADIRDYLTPSGSSDTTPPVVTVLSPNGSENLSAGSTYAVTWSASDANGIAKVDIYLSDDQGASFKRIARGEPDDGSFDWFVHNLPGSQNIIRVVAHDNAGNLGSDWSDAAFTINGTPAGFVPTTLRDMELPGTQPLNAGVFDDPDATCTTCHANYDDAVEPWYNWKGSMMAQAMRDPLFLACVAVAEQDAPSVGDLCLRCHTPGGWIEGRSTDTGGGLVTAKDRQGVQCDFCHRLVDPDYKLGVSPTADTDVLDSLLTLPYTYANGQSVTDPDPIRRGPFADADATHAFLASPFHTKADLCGTCHDVSNPVFLAGATSAEYVPNSFDTPHPDGDLRNMFPIERTYSEWSVSEYATTGVYAPQFAGNLPGGIVSTCQDCHMHDVSGKGCNVPGVASRTDLPLHDLTGGNYVIPDLLPAMYPGEVDSVRLQAGKQRAIGMLQNAATLALAAGQAGNRPKLTVTVTNETAHKLPSGYPEGRRIWINVKAFDTADSLVYESGAYDGASGVLTHDEDLKIYEIKPGISSRLSPVVGLPVAPSFHFVLNDSVFWDTRIPPRGYTYANFEAIQSPPVAYTYADGQYWDETTYVFPPEARFVEVKLYYQTTSKEYVEFLRDENVTNSAGQDFYDAWVAHGKGFPVTMAEDTTSLFIDPTGVGDEPLAVTSLEQNYPNPFNPSTTIRYSLRTREHVSIRVYDVSGALVRTLVDGIRPAGAQRVDWHGRNDHGASVASGIYFIELRTDDTKRVRKAVLLK